MNEVLCGLDRSALQYARDASRTSMESTAPAKAPSPAPRSTPLSEARPANAPVNAPVRPPTTDTTTPQPQTKKQIRVRSSRARKPEPQATHTSHKVPSTQAGARVAYVPTAKRPVRAPERTPESSRGRHGPVVPALRRSSSAPAAAGSRGTSMTRSASSPRPSPRNRSPR